MKKLYAFFAGISLTFSSLTSFAQWQATSGPLGAGHISSMAVTGTNVLAGTFTGGVFFSSDSGATWTASTGITNSTEAIALTVEGTNAFAGFSASLVDTFAVFLSTDNGASWTHTSLSYNYLFSLAAKPGYIIAGTWYGVSYSTNNGASWGGSSTGLPGNASVSALAFSGTKIFCGVAYSSSGGTGVFYSVNNGTSWNPFNTGWTNPVISALAVIGSDIFAGVSGSWVYKSATTAPNWSLASTGITGGNKTLYVLGNNLYAGTNNGIFVTTNSGGNWIDISAGLPVPGTIYSITSDGVYLYAGADSMVWRRPLAEIITSINNGHMQEATVSVYPDPFTTYLNITLAGNESSQIILMDITGRKLFQESFVNSVNVNTSQLSKGIYFYEVRNKNGVLGNGKLIKE